MDDIKKHIQFAKYVTGQLRSEIMNKRIVVFIDIVPGEDQVVKTVRLEDLSIELDESSKNLYYSYPVASSAFVLLKAGSAMASFKLNFVS